MEFYEFAKQFLVCGGFGMLVGLVIFAYGYWIYQLVVYIRKKVKAHKEKKATNKSSDN